MTNYTANVRRIRAAIELGIMVEEDWDGPSIKPGTLTDEQIAWLASWLSSEGIGPVTT